MSERRRSSTKGESGPPPDEELDGLPGLTIVGGRPSARPATAAGDGERGVATARRVGSPGPLKGSWQIQGNTAEAEIPVGLELLLLRAAADPDLAQRLGTDREGALRSAALTLTPSERSTLDALPAPVLAAILRNLQPQAHRRPSFLKRVAATMTGTVLFTTSEVACGGIMSEPFVETNDGQSDPGADDRASEDVVDDVDPDSAGEAEADADVLPDVVEVVDGADVPGDVPDGVDASTDVVADGEGDVDGVADVVPDGDEVADGADVPGDVADVVDGATDAGGPDVPGDGTDA